MPSWRQNTPGMRSRNIRMSLRESCLGFHDCWYLLQLWRMQSLDLRGAWPHGMRIVC